MARTPDEIADTAEADMNAAQREQLAVSLRMQGYEFAEIAAQCGYSSNGRPNAASAYKAWKRALHRIPRAAAEESRQQMALAYNVARTGLWPQFITGDPAAVRAWVALDEREAKLLGLDTPVKGAAGSETNAAPTVIIRTYGSAESPLNTDLL